VKIYILTLFPEECLNYFVKGIFKRAYNSKIIDLNFINLRDFADNKYGRVDDYPYGQKRGLVIRSEVIYNAVKSIKNFDKYKILYTCPKGKNFNQKSAYNLSKAKGLILILGYFEGIDERVFELLKIEKVSIGDFVLSSGELPALIIAESIIRLIPGVVGKAACVQNDSFVSGLLEHPQYTTPRNFLGHEIPGVLISGNHQAIDKWKIENSLKETLFNKPDLLKYYHQPDQKYKKVLETLLKET